ncbi:hypothetical protein [Janthinobacterium sp. ROICE36]|uniref:hypothetical protein n=1 Tax=Janthinobacterium sp. ROICE36 TaxID=2048670 RepID=UPI0011AFB3C6|nr:hypothetical protein [Janthinobacterium sp. ROICE36]
MGDFFYYGQKDMIRRLNELAGRGAVVASYAPAVGKSPLGGPNGFIDPFWLDSSLPIKSQLPISAGSGTVNKFGFNYLQGGQAVRMYKIATMQATASNTYASLRIDAMAGGWDGNGLTAMTIILGSRVAVASEGVFVDWTTSRYIPNTVRFHAYLEADNKVSVYLYLAAGAFAQASFSLLGMQTITYEAPVATDTATGALVWDSTAAVGTATYRSPRSYGTAATAPTLPMGTSFDSIVEVRAQDGATACTSYMAGAAKANVTAAGASLEVIRYGVAGNTGVNSAGYLQWLASAGNGSTQKEGYKLSLKARDTGSGTVSGTLFSVDGVGRMYAPWLKAGTASTRAIHTLNTAVAQFGEILEVGREGSVTSCMAIRASDGLGGWNNAQSVMYVGKNSTTNRGIASPGTFNAQGTDYAEYFVKCHSCAAVIAGQLVGVNNKNQVADLWSDAVMFAIKSTDPSFFGGDSWATDVGPRPSPQAGQEPTQPLRREDVVTQQPVPGTNPPEYENVVTEPGDTDDEWAEKQAAYTAALAAHNIAVQQDAEAMATFDAALEVERQKVDRIAIAGRVPVNVFGTQPGDYIVPVQDGAGIKGVPVHEDNLSMKQYFRAVGRVISIEPDGRAYVMVKVV